MNSPPRSLFVTNLAWISIALSGTYVFLAALQNLAAVMVPGSFLPPAELFVGFPPAFAWVAEHMRGLLLAGFALGIVALWASIDLMRRRPWSRIAFLALLALLVLLLAASIAWDNMLFSVVRQVFGDDRGSFGAMISTITIAVQVLVAIVALATAVVLGWVGWRLLQPAIRAEFRS